MKLKLLSLLLLAIVKINVAFGLNNSIAHSMDTSADGKKVAIEISQSQLHNELTVTVTKKQKYRVNLYNPNGAIIRSGETESVFRIDMSKYEQGEYVVEVIELATGNGYMKRVVKK